MNRAYIGSFVCLLAGGCGSESDSADAGCTTMLHWMDLDGDGFGDPARLSSACEPPVGSVDNHGDCDDANPNVHPGVEDTCNGVDDDCDGATDSPPPVWYPDADGDGFGTSVNAVSGCDRPSGYASNHDDCDDTLASVHPGALEVCNAVDDDCAGGVDDDVDADADGYIAAACGGDDCNDADTTIHSGAPDPCGDGVDNDCQGGDAFCHSFSGETSLSTSAAKISSEQNGAELGRLLEVGDVNADGIPDVLAAAEYLNSHGGGYILYGPLSGNHPTDDVGFALYGGAGDSHTGRSISVGDIDGDGFDDVGLGAPYSNEVFVELGPVTSDVDLTTATLHAVSRDEKFGHGHDIADVNDDGQDDLAIGSYLDGTGGYDAGAVFVNFGPLGSGEVEPTDDHDAALWGFETSLWAGHVVRVGGDFNGDGVGDTIVQAIGYTGGVPNAGAALVVFGPILGDRDLEDADAILAGETSASYCGESISHGDVDGDGITDALVGAPYSSVGASQSGAGYVMLGPVTGVLDLGDSNFIVRGSSSGAMAGSSLSAGDVDKDGSDDVLVGAPGDHTGGLYAGAAYFFYGPADGVVEGADADAVFVGEKELDQGGLGVVLGDLDGDGGADVLVSSPYDGAAGAIGGSVYVIYGSE